MKLSFSILLSILLQTTYAQIDSYSVLVEPVTIAGVSGIQSFAFAQHDNKWLIVGGRLDGLHRRQPFAAFDVAGHNTLIWVIDPVNQQSWTAPLSTLSVSMQEQLSATNPNFDQEGDMLYFIGGYGYSNTAADHITYDKLTAIDVPGVMNAIINGTPITSYFRQITDAAFAVTGGHLEKIYDTFYLVGGQKFDGRYNPMNNPTFTQEYTNQIRKFTITDDGTNVTVNHLPSFTDATNLHRRDYNVTNQIMPNGEEGLTAFSGVFQASIDLPYLNCVNIDSSGYAVNNNFSQYYNHYHCANLPVYDAANNEMHTFFFGGIAQYYDSSGILTQDNNVPFVKTIARVTRDATGEMTEYKLPVEMPALLGAGSEFIPNPALDVYPNGVLKLNSMTADTTLAGYIFGGISSTAANIFFTNTGTQSSASDQLFKVSFVKETATVIAQVNAQSTGKLKMQVYPNPNNGQIHVWFYLEQNGPVEISITDNSGKLLKRDIRKNMKSGDQQLKYTLANDELNGIYYVTVKTTTESVVQKIILDR